MRKMRTFFSLSAIILNLLILTKEFSCFANANENSNDSPTSLRNSGQRANLQYKDKSENTTDDEQRYFVDNVSKENLRLLDYFRKRNREGECNPETNIYPCGALDFLGCTGSKKFYAESVIRLNWFEAWEFCRNNGMHLASVESTYEQVFLELFLPKPESGSREGYWLSGTDFGREGLFYWMESGKSFTYTNWRASEPNNNKGREHCVQMNSNLRSKDVLKWNDVTCNSVGYVICQEPYMRKFDPAGASYDFIQERDSAEAQLVFKQAIKPGRPSSSFTAHYDDDIEEDVDVQTVINNNNNNIENSDGSIPVTNNHAFLQTPPILSLLAQAQGNY